jgi:hypothetical protein
MLRLPMQYKNNGLWWAFTRDNKQFFNLQIEDTDPTDHQLTDAYARHPKRFRDADSIEFVLLDEKQKSQKVRRVSMADIIEYEKLQRSFAEEAALRRQEDEERADDGKPS